MLTKTHVAIFVGALAVAIIAALIFNDEHKISEEHERGINKSPIVAQHSSDEIDSLLDVSKSESGIHEKKANIIALQAFYFNSSLGDRNKIISSLKGEIAKNNEASDLAVMVYSRLGYFDDTYEVLLTAHKQGIIDDSAFLSENLRHAFSEEPSKSDRKRFLETALSKQDEYTAEVLFSLMKERAGYPGAQSEDMKDISHYLELNKPEFSSDFSSLGIVSSEKYVNWLLASIYADNKILHSDQLLMALSEKFSKGFADPREAVALYSNELFNNIKNNDESATFAKQVRDKVKRYSESYPNNQVVKLIEE